MSDAAATGTGPPPDPIRVLVAEDDQSLRAALCDLVDAEADMETVGAASDAAEAVRLAKQTAPDVAVLDLKMQGGGANAAAQMHSVSPQTAIVALSAYEHGANVLRMLRSGAVAYLVKGTAPSEILEAIRRATRDQASISAPVAAAVIDTLFQEIDERRDSEERLASLLESAPDAVVITDANGKIVLVNAQTEVLFGYPRDELVGQTVELLLPAPVRERHVGHRVEYLADPRTRPMGVGLELAGRRKDGSEFPVDISLSEIESGEARLLSAFIRDITERRTAAEMQRSHAERRALLERFVRAVEEERRRIASDIHDDSIQAITAAGIRLQLLRTELRDPKQVELLAGLEVSIERSISRLRHLLFEVHPPALDQEGLAAALDLYIEESRDQSATAFRLEDMLHSQPDDEARIILYRIAQEALTNVRKHAHASEAEVVIAERENGFLLRVTDNGVGFAPEQSQSLPGHLGLAAMRERAELAGGRIHIESAPRTGTVVECWIPSLPGGWRNGEAGE